MMLWLDQFPFYNSYNLDTGDSLWAKITYLKISNAYLHMTRNTREDNHYPDYMGLIWNSVSILCNYTSSATYCMLTFLVWVSIGVCSRLHAWHLDDRVKGERQEDENTQSSTCDHVTS